MFLLTHIILKKNNPKNTSEVQNSLKTLGFYKTKNHRPRRSYVAKNSDS